jgi:hypothetical protein
MAQEFDELVLDEHNYPTWALDVKISLVFCGIMPAHHFCIDISTRLYTSSGTTSTPT